MSYFVYILQCSDKSYYCGVSNNPEKRLKEHNSGSSKASKYTRTRRPLKMIYKEQHGDLKTAMQRESQIKKWSKKKKENLIKGKL